MEALNVHHWLPYVGIAGLILTQWRFHVTQAAAKRNDEIARAQWRTSMEAKDTAHETRMSAIEGRLNKGDGRFDEITRKLDGLKDGQTRIQTEITAHRRICEERRGKG